MRIGNTTLDIIVAAGDADTLEMLKVLQMAPDGVRTLYRVVAFDRGCVAVEVVGHDDCRGRLARFPADLMRMVPARPVGEPTPHVVTIDALVDAARDAVSLADQDGCDSGLVVTGACALNRMAAAIGDRTRFEYVSGEIDFQAMFKAEEEKHKIDEHENHN